MDVSASLAGRIRLGLPIVGLLCLAARLPAQDAGTEVRDPHQTQDTTFAAHYREWTGPHHGSPLVDHLPVVKGIPSPRDVLGYDIGAPKKLTYYADMLKYYRALAKATPRVRVETIGRSDEGRELVVVWVSSEANMRRLPQNRANLAKLADPRGLSDVDVRRLIADTRPHYHLMGGLHSGETGPSEMLMELVYRLATETSPLISRIRDNVYVSVTPAADADGRDRNVDWFYHSEDVTKELAAASDSNGRGGQGGRGTAGPGGAGGRGGRGGGGAGSLPYWGKYVYHDNNRDINLSLVQIRALADWYFTAHPPIMHDLHEQLSIMYDYSGGPPQNPNLDPILFAELPWFANFEMAQMTKWGMPGVYDHGFMDGWSPGYLGSIAYNHNGMMKMYETQSGVDIDTTAGRGGRGGGGRGAAGRGGRGQGAAPADSTSGGRRGAAPDSTGARGAGGRGPGGGRAGGRGGDSTGGGRGNAAGARGAGAIPTGKGGEQDREWYRGLPYTPADIAAFSRRDNTNYMETGILSALQLTSMFPTVIVENFYVKTKNSIDEGHQKAPFGYVIPVRPDMTRAAKNVQDNTRAARAKKILVGLGFRQTDFERPIQELSGGWQMRVAIARLLLDEPDLLMLDEPTNHLDLESLLWFQNFLQAYRGAIFLISHDREFINDVVNRIVEVRARKLNIYTGTFEDYLAQKKSEEENLVSAYHRQQKEIKELTDFINKFRAKASTASRAQAKIKYLEKMERIELPETIATVGFAFPQPARSGQNVLTLKNIRQSYDSKHWVYDGLDLTLERGQKIGLVGPNGSGKSTLIKLLAGAIPFQEGERKLGYGVEAGYFSQHRAEMFKAGRTVLQEALDTQRNHTEQTVRTVLGSFLFRGDSVFKKVEVLSGGEKSRLGLARLLLDPPNLLLLDEPTTHLDMASVDVLVEALKKFEGTICFISHDVYFIRQLGDHIIHVKDGKVTWYPGDYDYFLHKKSQEEGDEGELFRSEERIEAAHHSPAVTPTKVGARSQDVLGPGFRRDDVKVPPRKSKEQKRLEAEQRQAKFRLEQELKRKADMLKQLKESESLLFNEMARLETHQNPARVKELSERLGVIQKQIKALG